jgi:hypothetical protein
MLHPRITVPRRRCCFVPQFNMAVQKTFSADSARFVFHGPTVAPSSPSWTNVFVDKQWNSANCNVLASLATQGVFASGGIEVRLQSNAS